MMCGILGNHQISFSAVLMATQLKHAPVWRVSAELHLYLWEVPLPK